MVHSDYFMHTDQNVLKAVKQLNPCGGLVFGSESLQMICGVLLFNPFGQRLEKVVTD